MAEAPDWLLELGAPEPLPTELGEQLRTWARHLAGLGENDDCSRVLQLLLIAARWGREMRDTEGPTPVSNNRVLWLGSEEEGILLVVPDPGNGAPKVRGLNALSALLHAEATRG